MLQGQAMGSMGANCYVFGCEETKKGVLVDPGDEGIRIFRWVTEMGYEITHILLTHGHLDHIGAVDELRERFACPVLIHAADADMLTSARKNLSAYFGPGLSFKAADAFLQDGQILAVGRKSVQVLHTPGHSPGSVCFLTEDGVLCGDTLFSGSIGRTDFPGGSLDDLLRGVETKLMPLADETKVYPGHGESTTIGHERRENPFL